MFPAPGKELGATLDWLPRMGLNFPNQRNDEGVEPDGIERLCQLRTSELKNSDVYFGHLCPPLKDSVQDRWRREARSVRFPTC